MLPCDRETIEPIGPVMKWSPLMRLNTILFSTLLFSMAGCGGSDEPPKPNAWRDDLFMQQMELPTLYLTEQTAKHVIAPASKASFVDEESGEVCWPAQACHNPSCLGRGPNGEPFLFIIPLPGGPKPTRVVDVDPATIRHVNTDGWCPQCWKTRRPHNESKELRQKYINWTRSHVLPEAAEKMKEIEAARIEQTKRKRRR